MPQIALGEAIAVPIRPTATTRSGYSQADTFVAALGSPLTRPGNTHGRTVLVALRACPQDCAMAAAPDGADSPAHSASPNEQLLVWAVRSYNLTPDDTIVLVNVRSEVASVKTKAYSTHVAAYASIYDAEERQKSLELLQIYHDYLSRRGFRCRALALSGDKREQIAAAAASEDADCIVVGQPRRHMSLIRTKRPLVTSLVQLTDIPVTAVPLLR